MTLRVTLRALTEDLDLDVSILNSSPKELAKHDKALKAFVKQRSQNPEGNETTQLPVSSQVVFNLHSGRYRGLTWFDRSENVVWLLGVGWHEKGSKEDAYAVLKRLDEQNLLLPGERDYRALYAWRENQGISDFAGVVRAAIEVGPALLDVAQGLPGHLCQGTLLGVLEVSVVVQDVTEGDLVMRRYEVRLYVPPTRPGVLPSGEDWASKLAPAFMPPDSDTSLYAWDFDADSGAVRAVYEEPLAWEE